MHQSPANHMPLNVSSRSGRRFAFIAPTRATTSGATCGADALHWKKLPVHNPFTNFGTKAHFRKLSNWRATKRSGLLKKSNLASSDSA
jgi:hypothetical protein